MLKLNTDKLHYAIKRTDNGFAYTRSLSDDITLDSKIVVCDSHEVSAWFAESVTGIIKDLKLCGFTEWDIFKAENYMTFEW